MRRTIRTQDPPTQDPPRTQDWLKVSIIRTGRVSWLVLLNLLPSVTVGAAAGRVGSRLVARSRSPQTCVDSVQVLSRNTFPVCCQTVDLDLLLREAEVRVQRTIITVSKTVSWIWPQVLGDPGWSVAQIVVTYILK